MGTSHFFDLMNPIYKKTANLQNLNQKILEVIKDYDQGLANLISFSQIIEKNHLILTVSSATGNHLLRTRINELTKFFKNQSIFNYINKISVKTDPKVLKMIRKKNESLRTCNTRPIFINEDTQEELKIISETITCPKLKQALMLILNSVKVR